MRATRTKAAPARRSTSTALGGRLRSVLMSPRSGFRSAMRDGVATRAARSPLTSFMVLLGGIATMALWLKVTGLAQVADRPSAEATWATVLPTLALGGLFGILAYISWSRYAPRMIQTGKAETMSERLKLVWSFADFPLALYAAVILPLDFLIVGPEIFSTDPVEGTFAMIWAGLSVALLVSAAAWSIYLFTRGVEAATGKRGGENAAPLISAFLAIGTVYVLLLFKELFE